MILKNILVEGYTLAIEAECCRVNKIESVLTMHMELRYCTIHNAHDQVNLTYKGLGMAKDFISILFAIKTNKIIANFFSLAKIQYSIACFFKFMCLHSQ